MVCWVSFFGISTIVDYECQIHFYAYKQFYFNQFNLAWLHFFKNLYTVKCKNFYFKQFSLALVNSFNVKNSSTSNN